MRSSRVSALNRLPISGIVSVPVRRTGDAATICRRPASKRTTMTDCLIQMDAAPPAVVSFGTRWSIGHRGGSAVWQFQASIADEAAVITHGRSGYTAVIDAASPQPLQSGQVLSVGDLQFTFSQPHPWSAAATLTRTRGPRASDGTDVLLLAAGPVLLGHEPDSHLVVAEAGATVVLFLPPTSERNASHEETSALCWKRFSAPLDTEPVNLVTLPAFLEMESLRIHLRPR